MSLKIKPALGDAVQGIVKSHLKLSVVGATGPKKSKYHFGTLHLFLTGLINYRVEGKMPFTFNKRNFLL